MSKLAPISALRLFILSFLHFSLIPPSTANNQSYVHYCNHSDGNYTTNSPYKTNLDSLLAKITSTDITSGFYNFSAGQSPDVAYLISMCTGFLPVSDCHACQVYLQNQTTTLCPNQKIVVFWSDDCMLRYSNLPIFGILDDSPVSDTGETPSMLSDNKISDKKYNEVVNQSVVSLPKIASAGNSSLKFAIGEAAYNASITIFSAAQCTPDLSQQDCLECLNKAVVGLRNVSSGSRGARYLLPSCNVRYEENMFYPSNAVNSESTPTSSTTANGKGGKGKTKTIVAAVAGSLCVVLVVVASFILLRKRKPNWNLLNNLNHGDEISSMESLQFNFGTIKAATGNFSEANKLGQGGFGAVYKGLLDDGQEIAVKRLAGNSSQGEDEFRTEVTLLAKLQHRNSVRLLGFCFHNKERLLIYEFVANASLDHFLFGERTHLDWETRYKIIRGIARGILYLHEDSRLRIIHRDLKPSNVLLDAEMCPKIADFGTARLFEMDQTQADTRRIVGTYGYMAPEYVLHGNFSIKSDVYSFGIMLLEIVCGKKCNTTFSGETSGSLIGLIWRKWKEGTPLDVADSSISDGPESEILRCIHIGLLCIQDNMVDRPTMSSVVLMMSSESLALPVPLHPAYIMTSSMPLKMEDMNWSTDRSADLESITDLHVR